MSKVKIQGNASGTGIFTVAAPATNTDRTITLPDVNATVLTTVGGTITGRTTVKDDVNSDKSYPFGIQNQSQQPWWLRAETTSNRFSIHLNGFGNALEIDSSGRITKPSQPAFRAYKDTNQTITNNGADIKVEYNQIYTNIGSHYSTSNFRFTAPIAGFYFFTAWFMINSYPTDATYQFIRFVKNGSESNSEFMYRAPSGAYLTLHGSTHMYLYANDYVEVYTRQAGGSANSNIRNGFAEFQGRLVS